jgi:D-glycero-alpha-D-manno-heptose 1-phosphate guanylyltransferase
MEAIILAGGLGTRLRSVVSDLPKPMASINGRPFLEILMTDLKNKGFKKVILCVGYLKEKIIDYFSQSLLDIEIEFSSELEPLGTGGAIKNAIEKCSSDHVYVFNGDTFQEFDPLAMNELWFNYKAPVVLLRSPPDEQRYGGVAVNGREIVNFKTSQGNSDSYINAGVYILPKTIFDNYQVPEKFSIEEFFKENIDTLKMRYTVAENDSFTDIGTPLDYAKFISKQ